MKGQKVKNRKDMSEILDGLRDRFPDLSRTAIRLRMRRGDLVLLEIAAEIQKRLDERRSTAQKAIAGEIAVVCVEVSGAMITEDEAAQAVRILSTPPDAMKGAPVI